MFTKQVLSKSLLAALTVLAFACGKDDDNSNADNGRPRNLPFALGIGVTDANNVTTNYVVPAARLDSGVISPVGIGVTLLNYRDYSAGNKTVFATGGLGSVDVNAVGLDGSGELVVKGSSTFDRAADDMQQVDSSTMLAIDYPSTTEGDQARFYFVDINSATITKNVSQPVAPLIAGSDYPVETGMLVRGNKLYVSYMHFAADYSTNHMDTNYIAVYSYPALQFEKLILDTRTGPTGSWATRNGLFKTESGDIYAMSNSSLANGYSKATKPGGFLRINAGAETFEPGYFFNTDLLGGKIAHIKYLGNNKVFAAISTLTTQTADDRWSDKNLKLAIIDVVAETITDVKLAGGTAADLVHNGVGGRSFPVFVEGGFVYYPITLGGTTNIYKVDVANATATKGAKIEGSFVGGVFRVK